MRSFTVEGIVIKRSNLGEADRLITLFTKSHGKVTAIARGVRKLTSKRVGSVELFNLIKAQIVEGRGDLPTLAEVAPVETFRSWRRRLGRVNLAYQMCEAVDKLTADHQPHPDVFNILVTALSQIGSLGSNWEEQLHHWLVEIVRSLGFWPRNRSFSGDIYQLLEEIASRPFHSANILQKLR